jgi:outer membrane protein assembly factor BamB
MSVPFQAARRKIKVVTVILAGSALLAAAGALAGASSAATVSSPWTQTDYNAAQSRANLTEQTLTLSTVPGVRYLRSIAGPPLNGCLASAFIPVLTGGDLYAVANGRLFKADAATGNLLWRRTPDPGFSTDFPSISVAHGLVVLGEADCGSESDPDGHLQAFNATTGAAVWKQPITSFGGALNHAVVSGYFVAVSGVSVGGGAVVAVHSLTTGAQIWTRGTEPCGTESAVNVLVVAKEVVSGSCNASGNPILMARALGTGTKTWSRAGAWHLWRGDTGGLTGRNLVVTNPSGAIVDLNPLRGATRFSLSGATNVLAIGVARIYADCGPSLCAYSTTNGALLWSDPGVTTLLAAEAGGVLYLDQGQVLDAKTGKAIASSAPTPTGQVGLWFNGDKASALVVGDGRVAAVTDPRVADLYGLPGF